MLQLLLLDSSTDILSLAAPLLVLQKGLEMLLLRVDVVHFPPAVVIQVAEAAVHLVRHALPQRARQSIHLCFVVYEQINDIFARLLYIL